MQFQDLVKDLLRIAKHLNNLEDNLEDHSTRRLFYRLTRSLREKMAAAGRTLLTAFREERLEAPKQPLPWLSFTLGERTVRFKSWSHTYGAAANAGEKPFARTFMSGLLHAQVAHERRFFRAEPDVDWRSFHERHVFLEAATRWLKCRKKVTSLEHLPAWAAETTDEDAMKFVSDWLCFLDEQLDVTRSIADVCVRACKELHGIMGKGRPVSFQQLSEEFTAAVDRHRERQDCEALLSEVRDIASRAGRLLLAAIDDQGIAQPDNSPPWLRLALGEAEHTLFFKIHHEALKDTPDPSPKASEDSVPTDWASLPMDLSTFQSASSRGRGTSKFEWEPESFLHRHLFFEAVTVWLPKQFSEKLRRLDLPHWLLTAKDGRVAKLVSDWAHPGTNVGRVDFATRLAELCGKACRGLSELVPAEQPPGDQVENETRLPGSHQTAIADLDETAQAVARHIDANPGAYGKNIAAKVGISEEHLRRIVREKLKPLGYFNRRPGYHPPSL